MIQQQRENRMKTFVLAIVLGLLPTLVQAEYCQTRELGRVSVFDRLGEEQWVDSAVIKFAFGVDFYGESRICAEYQGGPIKTIEYEANLLYVDGTVANRFEIYDMVDVLGFTQNGARYDVRSRYVEVGDYEIRFIRRAPDLQLVEVNGEEHVVPNYDRATIFMVEMDGLIWELDYRGTD